MIVGLEAASPHDVFPERSRVLAMRGSPPAVLASDPCCTKKVFDLVGVSTAASDASGPSDLAACRPPGAAYGAGT
jgi:hypothetical protein